MDIANRMQDARVGLPAEYDSPLKLGVINLAG